MLKYFKRQSEVEDETNNVIVKKQRVDSDTIVSNNNDERSDQAQAECSTTNTNFKSVVTFPDCWSEEQYNYFTSENTWLEVKNKLLGCRTCREVSLGGMGSQRGAGIKFSKEWIDCKINSNGQNKAKEQTSLRKKIFVHKTSQSHTIAELIKSESKKQKIEAAIDDMNAKHLETTIRIFRTVYKIAKQNRPYSDLPVDVELQELNGLNMGRVLHSRFMCADIIDHIAREMRKKIAQTIIENNRRISIMLDESSTISRKSALVLCLRCPFSTDAEPVSFFWDLIELEATTAQAIRNACLSNLKSYGMDEEFLKFFFISLACDGASVMLGKNAGVATELKKLFPSLFIWHCSNHRLELAVSDTRHEVQGVNHFQMFFDKLYSLYSLSAKNQRELMACSSVLDQRLKKVGKIFTIRWVSSSLRTVKAVWDGYSALATHFSVAKDDKMRDSKERAKYEGLYKYFTSFQFIMNLGIMHDALTELSELSLSLQRQDMTLPDADSHIKRTIQVLESMCDLPGDFVKEASKAVDDKTFQNIELQSYSKVSQINRSQFFRSLVSNLNNRLVENINRSSHESTNPSVKAECSDFMHDIKVLFKKNWPSDVGIRYGEESISNLCNSFNFPEKRKFISAFREYIDTGNEPKELKPLLQTVKTIPISTSECERAFSSMNNIMTDIRNSLSVERASSQIFVSRVGPPLKEFCPEPYVKSWLRSGRRLADERACKKAECKDNASNYDSLWKILD